MRSSILTAALSAAAAAIILLICAPAPARPAPYSTTSVIPLPNGHTETQGEIRLPSGNIVKTRIIVPLQAQPAPAQRIPALIVLAGFQNPTQGLDVLSTDEVILASFEYPFYSRKNFSPLGALKYLPEAKRMAHETLQAIDVLRRVIRAHPAADPERMGIIGASFGSFFAALAAQQWPEDFKLVTLVHGFADVPRAAAHHLTPKLGQPLAWLLCHSAWLYLGLPSPEKRMERLSPSQSVIVMEAAEADTYIPEEVSESLWNAISRSPARSERMRIGNGHIDAKNGAVLHHLSRAVEAWMKNNGWNKPTDQKLVFKPKNGIGITLKPSTLGK